MKAAQKREQLQRFEERCRARGISQTVQRRIIFEAVAGRTDHPTADQVYAAVRRRIPGVSRTTVYRALDVLVEVGLINKACSPGAAARFDPMTDRHHHLVCIHCEKLIDITDDRLDRHVRLPDVKAHEFEIRDFSIHFHGVCAACKTKRHDPKRSGPPSARRGGERDGKRITGTKATRTPARRKKP